MQVSEPLPVWNEGLGLDLSRENRRIEPPTVDPLTNLLTRTNFLERLECYLSLPRRRDEPVAVFYLDLDDFKLINAELGYGAGDSISALIGQRLQRAVRSLDVVGRLGSDEFAILPRAGRTPVEAASFASRLLAAVQTPIYIAGREMVITASVGVAVAQTWDRVAGELLRQADMASDYVKVRGGGGIAIFDSAMDDCARKAEPHCGELRRAIASGQLRLFFQPEVELESGRVVSVEALVRWMHPERGLLAPSEFVPAAEAAGIVAAIDAWCMVEACRQAQRWHELFADAAPAVAVNISAQSFREPALVEGVVRALAEAHLPASLLRVELTESALIDDIAAAARTLDELRRLGVRVAIDDFGTGYSALGYLQHLSVDSLKVDRTIVAEVLANDASGVIVSAVADLARGLHLDVTAEGIETPDQIGKLRSIGITYGQGYLFSPPLSADAMTQFLAEGRAGEPASHLCQRWPDGCAVGR